MRQHEIETADFDLDGFADLAPLHSGREVCEPGHAFGPARRSHYLFHYVVAGTGTYTTVSPTGTRVEHRIGPGEGFVIFPHEIAVYVADLDDPWEYLWFEFDGAQARGALERLGFSIATPIYRAQDQAQRDAMADAMRSLLTRQGSAPYLVVSDAYRFLDGFSRSAEPYRAASLEKLHDAYIDDALAFIASHYQEEIGVESIAKDIGLNRSYFGKLFKEAMGVSPQQFLIGYRMEKAADLLRSTGLSIAEIGSRVGYPNQLHFSRAFKNVYGTAPRTWRRTHLNGDSGGKQDETA